MTAPGVVVQRLRLGNDVPLKASHADGRVHGLADWESGNDKVQPLSGVTDLRVSQRNVEPLLRGGRARWKMERATLQTRKNQDDNCAHTDGHGERHLAVVWATMLRLAFWVDQPQPLCGAFCRAVWATRGSTRLWWERRRAVC